MQRQDEKQKQKQKKNNIHHKMRYALWLLFVVALVVASIALVLAERKPRVGLVIAMSLEAQPFIDALGLVEVPRDSNRRLWLAQPNRVFAGQHRGVEYKLVTNGLAPWMDPALKVEMVGETGAVVSTLMLLDGGFEPDLLVSAGTVGGWSDRFNVGDVGLCAGGQSIPYSDRNISANAGYQAYGWGHFPCTAVVPDEVLAAAGVRPALIATHHSFVAPPDEAARLTAWGVDMVEQEGAAVAQQALFYGVPFMKVGGVVNSYALPHQNCAADLFFSCWKNTASKVANTTISIIKQVVHQNI
jgi:nucleoside phosphorylase